MGSHTLTSSTTLATSTVPPPANVEVLHADETSITLGWGPTLPGELFGTNAKPRSLRVNWASSQAARMPVSYTFTNNGKVTARGLTRLYNDVGFTLAVRTFRACVFAVDAIGRSGPAMCATFSGS